MKVFLFFTIFALLVGIQVAGSQILVEEYSRKNTAEVGQLDQVAAPKVSSDCGVVKTSYEDKLFSGGCLGTITRTYNFTDDCGNVASAEQYIQVKDFTPPQFTNLPAAASYTQEAVPIAPSIDAIDNSGKRVRIDFSEEKSDRGIIRKWTATDQCGNVATGTQEITFLKI